LAYPDVRKKHEIKNPTFERTSRALYLLKGSAKYMTKIAKTNDQNF